MANLQSEKFAFSRYTHAGLLVALQSAFLEYISSSPRPLLLIGLPGGHSLDRFYNGLGVRIPETKRQHLFFFPVDERVLAKESEENNGYRLQKLLGAEQLATPKQVLLPELEDMKSYGTLLSTLAPEGADLLIFGVGEDGHIASLFPKRKELSAKGEEWLEVKYAPKPPPSRVSISPVQIRKAKEVWLVFRGEEKRMALESFLHTHTSVKDCPAKLVLGGACRVRVWTDLQ